MGRVLRIAHRGASSQTPENTLTSFERALKIGVDLVELDVHMTADGEIVVIHDSTLDRTTDSKGSVKELTLAQIKQADAGSWFDPKFTGEKVPTLGEVLDLVWGKALTLIEIKPDDISTPVVKAVEKYDAIDEVVIQSFNPKVVKEVRAINPNIPTSLLVGGIRFIKKRRQGVKLVQKAIEQNANALSISFGVVSPELVEEIHLRGLTVWTWTVNELSEIEAVIEAGVDGVISDCPEKIGS